MTYEQAQHTSEYLNRNGKRNTTVDTDDGVNYFVRLGSYNGCKSLVPSVPGEEPAPTKSE